MSFGRKKFVFKEGKLYRYTLVSFRDGFDPEYQVVYDPEKDCIETLYRTLEEIYIAGYTDMKNKFKDLLR